MKPREMMLSLSDLWLAIRRRKVQFLLVAAVMGFLGFYSKLRVPIHYTATALFKSEGAARNRELSDVLEKAFKEGADKPGNADSLVLFSSWPVMERVVKELSLQGTVHERSVSRRRRFWQTLLAEGAHIRYRKGPKPASNILAGDLPAPDRNLFPDLPHRYRLSDVTFNSEISKTIRLRFLDETRFEIPGIGEGTLGEPFVWDEGSFTLSALDDRGGEKRVYLTFIPMSLAIKSLQRGMQIELDKKQPSLIHLSYTHPDRHLATAIVNKTIEAFPAHLKDTIEKKIAYQLAYLDRREGESLTDLNTLWEEHQTLFASYADERGFLSADRERDFISNMQLDYQKRLEEIGPQLPAEKSISSAYSILSRKAAEGLLADLQLEVDKLALQDERYHDCLQKLEDPSFPLSACSRTLSEPTLEPFFKKVETLQHKLADLTHYTSKEIDQIGQELKTERHYLVSQLVDRETDNRLQRELLGKKIEALKGAIGEKLRAEYTSIEKKLKSLSLKTSPFAKKWLSEQKLELRTQLHRDLAMQLAQMIESKNLTYHMEYFNTEPLEAAIPPLLPDPPRLRRFLVLGALAGVILYLTAIVLMVARAGPSASRSNLQALGYLVIDSLDEVPFLYDRSQKTLLIRGEELATSFHKRLKKLGEEVSWVTPGEAVPPKRTLIVVPSTLSTAQTKRLSAHVDAVLFELKGEKLEAIYDLPTEKTVFFLAGDKTLAPIPLPRLEPILERLKKGFFYATGGRDL